MKKILAVFMAAILIAVVPATYAGGTDDTDQNVLRNAIWANIGIIDNDDKDSQRILRNAIWANIGIIDSDDKDSQCVLRNAIWPDAVG